MMKHRSMAIIAQSLILIFNLAMNLVWLYVSLKQSRTLVVVAQLLLIGIVMLLPGFIIASYLIYPKRWSFRRYLYSVAASLIISSMLYAYQKGLW